MKIDKQLHIACGAAMAAVLSPFGLPIALAGTFVAAVGKEIVDKFTHGNPDPYDAAATMGGGLAAMALQAGLVYAAGLMLA